MNRIPLAIALGCLAVALPARAQSDSANKTTSLKVSYADLDIQHDAGARVLLARLRHAANEVCAPAPDRELSSVAQFEACFKSALDGAVSQVSSATLSGLYAGMPVGSGNENVAAR
jgi:UrcA family protein